MKLEDAKKEFERRMRLYDNIISAVSMLSWDMETIMPKKAAEARAQTMSVLEGEAFRLVSHAQFGEALNVMKTEESKLDTHEKRILQLALFEYNRMKDIPAQLYEDYSLASANSINVWKEAKAKNDVEMFLPHLEKNIEFKKKFGEYWGYEKSPYDAQLAGYDPDLLTEQLDPLFAALRNETVRLLAKVPQQPEIKEAFVPEQNQAKLAEYLLKEIGFDLEAGMLATTEHPFTNTVHKNDVRLTTHYYEDNPSSSIFSVLHEGGHGLYEQGFNPNFNSSLLANATSLGMHESQSRFWENIIGRNLNFWQSRFDEINSICGTKLAPNAETYWKSVNRMQPSLIRIEADELSYNLHIIIRYELEKMIFEGTVPTSKLPSLWREKYHDYIGLTPETDSKGIMQDTHWPGGMFGYFPSYSIGNLYSAQFADAIEKQLGSIDSLCQTKQGLAKILDWQRKNIHNTGSLETSAQVLRRVCGQDLAAEYFTSYIEGKISLLSK